MSTFLIPNPFLQWFQFQSVTDQDRTFDQRYKKVDLPPPLFLAVPLVGTHLILTLSPFLV